MSSVLDSTFLVRVWPTSWQRVWLREVTSRQRVWLREAMSQLRVWLREAMSLQRVWLREAMSPSGQQNFPVYRACLLAACHHENENDYPDANLTVESELQRG